MRPLCLKIKGLNSFIEEQQVDFVQLTSRGFFGIFGPTGSGKSSILDGITLALYGDVARNSSNFINSNVEKAYVSFEFQISNASVKRYLVEREFRFDKKAEAPRSGKCKIVDMTSEEPEILAEGKKAVDAKCVEIIGLGVEDFTRTVVLPQGKFSEFLKMEGKQRRDMLERLFNLQLYGEDLRRKLVAAIEKEKAGYQMLLGQTLGYEGVSEERLNQVKEQHKKNQDSYIEHTKELESLSIQYKEVREIRELIRELNEYQNQRNNHLVANQDIEDKANRLKAIERAYEIYPSYQAFYQVREQINVISSKQNLLEERKQAADKMRAEVEVTYLEAKEKNEKRKPRLLVMKQKVYQGLLDYQQIKRLQESIQSLTDDMEMLINKEATKQSEIANQKEVILYKESEIERIQKELQRLRIDGNYKEFIKRGEIKVIALQSSLSTLKETKKRMERASKDYQEAFDSLNKNQSLLAMLDGEQENTSNLIKACSQKMTSLEENIDLLRERIVLAKQSWSVYKKSSDEINEINRKLTNEKSEINKFTEELPVLINKHNLVKEKLTELKTETIAQELRKELIDGNPCPVCGSTTHQMTGMHKLPEESKTELEQEIDKLQSLIKERERQLTVGSERVTSFQLRITELNKTIDQLPKETLAITEEELVKQYNSTVGSYNEEQEAMFYLKEQADKEVARRMSLVNENGLLNGRLTSTLKLTEDLTNQIQLEEQKVAQLNMEIEELTNKTNVSDFQKEAQRIQTIDKEIVQMESVLNESREQISALKISADNIKEELVATQVMLVTMRTKREQNIREKEEKQAAIKESLGEIQDIESYYKELDEKIKTITIKYQEQEVAYTKVLKEQEEASAKLFELLGKMNQLHEQLDATKEAFYHALHQYGFDSYDEVVPYIVSREEFEKLRVEIEEYKEKLAKLTGAIESVTSKLKERSVSEEECIEMEEMVQEKQRRVEEQKKVLIMEQKDIQKLEEDLSELKDILVKKQKIEHKMAVLMELDTLFKGKKFVEYVALQRLQYISRDASKRLLDITNGIYGLETDENGKFLVRDNKNGGALRDASTLSGGETFLTSLALALSLSAEIQLKGTAPLELFFLDEGFGTLDDNLLDVVMGSLERIHNDQLKVGIISHVESVKNRVPVKLIVAPAVAGEGGSKVSIAYS